MYKNEMQSGFNFDRTLFGDYAPAYPGDVQRIRVYCDDSLSIYAALSKAYT